LSLKKLYTFVSHFLKGVGPNRQAKKEEDHNENWKRYGKMREDVNFLGS